jgi:hypothetical protein
MDHDHQDSPQLMFTGLMGTRDRLPCLVLLRKRHPDAVAERV